MSNNLPSMFAMTSSFSVSDGLLFGLDDEKNEKAVVVKEKIIKGTISMAKEEKKTDKEIKTTDANIQKVDVACLPIGTDTLRLKFTLKVVPNIFKPSSCNDIQFRKMIADLTCKYIELDGVKELARRYATQVLSGDYLWRNKDCLDLSISATARTRNETIEASNKNGDLEGYEELVDVIEKTLKGENGVAFIRVTADAQLDEMAEVYPSQEFVDDEARKKKGKTLYFIEDENGVPQAALHSQKIGNSLRRIDDWYSEEDVKKIAVEPFGFDQETNIAYRNKNKKNSLYTYLKDLENALKDLEERGVQDYHHFVMACFIRGGVFGGG